jgi:hypothetical protein
VVIPGLTQQNEGDLLMYENIEDNGKLIALILHDIYNKEGATFLTTPDNSFQLGVHVHKKEDMIKPHIHKNSIKKIKDVQEVLHISYGKVEAIFYNDFGKEIVKKILKKGDTILLISGGHGFKFLEDSKMIEVKQGPYRGTENDKIRFEK